MCIKVCNKKMDQSKWFIKWSVFCQQRFKNSMLRSDLCDYSDEYIVVKWKIILLASASNENDKAEKNL